jgi:hypothetical protein
MSDTPLAFGIKRFPDTDGNALWRFEIRRYVGGDVLHTEDATPVMLWKMMTWCQSAMATVETDGNRKTAAVSKSGHGGNAA